MQTKLKKGYTTGVHASFAFRSALDIFCMTDTYVVAKTNKMDNDDLDVTKGCEIVVCISQNIDDIITNPLKHKPYLLSNGSSVLELYAGVGVGVVTKDGLKPPKNHPAINPVPLQSLDKIFQKQDTKYKKLYATISVTHGEKIAKQTANKKVGIYGGISILGTTGFVKPISSKAYIDSIAQEINFAKVNNFDSIIFTLGNSAYKKALKLNNQSYIIEIGNFIYDGISLATEFKNITLMIGTAKAIKIIQGFKNTHNRFGDINLQEVQTWCDIDISGAITIKRIKELLGDKSKEFDSLITKKTQSKLYKWFKKDIKVIIC
jgi:cobalt-precorrin-5B (C1)-methyltransferase